MLKSQDLIVALGLVVALGVILFGTSSYHAPGTERPKVDSTSIREVAPEPYQEEDERSPEASPSQPRADSLPIVTVALPSHTSR
jgi:hypothetical protein